MGNWNWAVVGDEILPGGSGDGYRSADGHDQEPTAEDEGRRKLPTLA